MESILFKMPVISPVQKIRRTLLPLRLRRQRPPKRPPLSRPKEPRNKLPPTRPLTRRS